MQAAAIIESNGVFSPSWALPAPPFSGCAFLHFTTLEVGRTIAPRGGDLEATMIQQKEVQAYRLNDGETSRVKRSATAWLVFYAVAATVGLITKAGEAGLQLTGLSP